MEESTKGNLRSLFTRSTVPISLVIWQLFDNLLLSFSLYECTRFLQQYCLDCHCYLNRVLQRNHNRRCDACREKNAASHILSSLPYPPPLLSGPSLTPVVSAIDSSVPPSNSSVSAVDRRKKAPKVNECANSRAEVIYICKSHLITWTNSFLLISTPFFALLQKYCLDCLSNLSPALQRSGKRRCDSCRAKNAHSSVIPSQTPPPLFERQPHSHLPLTHVERAGAVVLTRIGETQQEAAERLGTSRQRNKEWKEMGEEAKRHRRGFQIRKHASFHPTSQTAQHLDATYTITTWLPRAIATS